MNLSDVVLQFAARLGADRAFALTGGMAMHLNRALYEHPDIRTVFCHHETVAVAAAEGYSKSYDMARCGLAVITSGPAVTNCLTGLASAHGDSVPVLVVAGQAKTDDLNPGGLRTLGVQEVNQLALVSSVSKFAARLTLENHARVLSEAFTALTQGRLGPVFLEIPLDEQPLEACSVQLPGVSDSQRYDRVGLIPESSRPVVLIGNGARTGSERLRPIVSRLHEARVPRLYTWLSFDLEEHSSSGNMGCPGPFAPEYANWTLTNADLVITVGARLDRATTAYAPNDFGAQAPRIIVDIDESELSKLDCGRTVKLQMDAIDALIEVQNLGLSGVTTWYEECQLRKVRGLQEEDRRLSSEDLTVRMVALLVSEASRNVSIVAASSGFAEEVFTRFLRPQSGTKFFNGAALGSMGLGLAHGLGAAMGSGRDRSVWIFEGDGGLWMNVQELATMAESRPRGTCLFVFENGGYASIQNSQRTAFGYEFGASATSGVQVPSVEPICEALSLPFRRIASQIEFRSFLSDWTQDREFEVVELSVPALEDVGPRVTTKFVNGKPTTASLRELAWPKP